jgi:plasmid stabilization system protein ParE
VGCGDNMNPIILKLARDDLKEIRAKLAEYGKNPTSKFRDSFEKFCTNITNVPYMYPQYDLNPNYRRAVIEYDYLVFYQVESVNKKDIAKVYRVLHGKREVLTLLSSETDGQDSG